MNHRCGNFPEHRYKMQSISNCNEYINMLHSLLDFAGDDRTIVNNWLDKVVGLIPERLREEFTKVISVLNVEDFRKIAMIHMARPSDTHSEKNLIDVDYVYVTYRLYLISDRPVEEHVELFLKGMKAISLQMVVIDAMYFISNGETTAIEEYIRVVNSENFRDDGLVSIAINDFDAHESSIPSILSSKALKSVAFQNHMNVAASSTLCDAFLSDTDLKNIHRVETEFRYTAYENLENCELDDIVSNTFTIATDSECDLKLELIRQVKLRALHRFSGNATEISIIGE